MTLIQGVLLLVAAVLIVPLSKRLGLGTVLGFLIAGALLGPAGFGLIPNVESILHFAELGVVLLLFIIGLELQPSRLLALRKSIFGLGAAQVGITGGVIAALALLFGIATVPAILIGVVLSFSSTAFALQLLGERSALTTHYGRSAFAILLFQDLAAIPLLALIPLLSPQTDHQAFQLWPFVRAIVTVAAVVVGGRYLLRPFFRVVAATDTAEIFTAASLLVVMGTALMLQQVGFSMALGSFVAGVLLADSEYRHELEADIEPFKGLLLGLFFMAVGMGLNLALVVAQPLLVLGLVLALLLIKAAVLYGIGRLSGHPPQSALPLGLFLSQGGEFAFVLFAAASDRHVLPTNFSELFVVVVSLSMAATPLLLFAFDRVKRETAEPARPFDHIEEQENPVIIAGFGRFGQIVARLLRVKKIPFTALEASFEQVDFVRRFGNKIYFGDASRLEMLRAAKADKAKLFVLAIDDVAASIKTAEMVKRHYPNLKIYARARNRFHTYQLMDIGVDKIVRETFHSSLMLSKDVLRDLGFPEHDIETTVEKFKRHDEALIERQHLVHQDEAQLIATSKQAAEELQGLFEEDVDVEQRP